MTTIQLFLFLLLLIYIIPLSLWYFLKTDYFAPLVVIQIFTGIILGPGIFGAFFPGTYHEIFNASVIPLLNGLAYWGVMIFVFLAGIELDINVIKKNKKEVLIVNALSIAMPLIFGSLAAFLLKFLSPDLLGSKARDWQFLLGVGMASAVTALPILILFLQKLKILKHPFGQRVLSFASIGDVMLWSILAVILMEWSNFLLGLIFFLTYLLLGSYLRKKLPLFKFEMKMYISVIWLILCALGADYCGMHFMVGAFLSGVILDIDWYKSVKIDALRGYILILLMPIFFLSTGLKTDWGIAHYFVIFASLVLFIAQFSGKLIGTMLAGLLLNWKKGEASIVAGLLQTKALIEIIFANILLDKDIISNQMFTALLFMALISTMFTMPFVAPRIKKFKAI